MLIAAAVYSLLSPIATSAAGQWSVTPRGAVVLIEGSVAGIREFSGVTYLGASPAGAERFAAIQDDGNQIVTFDVAVAADGELQSARTVGRLAIAPAADYEGLVFTGAARNTIFVCEETTPGIYEHSLASGERLKKVELPRVFATRRTNRGLESLARSASGRRMWTANEEALAADGAASTLDRGTVVRLQRMDDDGAHTSLGSQFAYRVEAIHAGTKPQCSGLVELTLLPDDTLIALERSFNRGAFPPFCTSIFQVVFTGATDISGPLYADGLAGKNYQPVVKKLLWSGAIGGVAGSGNNVEGLTLGPQLASRNWLLLGVADNGGIGPTMIVSFELANAGAPTAGDHNRDRHVDAADYTR